MPFDSRQASKKSRTEQSEDIFCACAIKEEDSQHSEFYATEVRRSKAKYPASKKARKEPAMLKSIATLTGIRAKKWVGAHLSAAGGPHNAIESAMQVGASAFALFLKSQRRWDNPPMAPSVAKLFMENGTQNGFIPVNSTAPLTIPVSQRILPHGSYLINLANADAEKRQKSFENFVDDLKRCEACHIGLYNFHPGSTVGSCSEEEGIRFIAEAINRAHEETSFVTIVLENMVYNF